MEVTIPDLDDDYDNRHYAEVDSMHAIKKKHFVGINPEALFDDPEAPEDWEDEYDWIDLDEPETS